jgi:hypothetical protein
VALMIEAKDERIKSLMFKEEGGDLDASGLGNEKRTVDQLWLRSIYMPSQEFLRSIGL